MSEQRTSEQRNEPVPHVHVPASVLDDIRASIRFLTWCRDNDRDTTIGFEWLKCAEQKLPWR